MRTNIVFGSYFPFPLTCEEVEYALKVSFSSFRCLLKFATRILFFDLKVVSRRFSIVVSIVDSFRQIVLLQLVYLDGFLL